MYLCLYLSGEIHGKESKEKTTWPRLGSNKSLEKRALLGERKEGKSVRCVGYLGVCCLSTPANEKLLSIFHHTQESFRYSLKVVCVV